MRFRRAAEILSGRLPCDPYTGEEAEDVLPHHRVLFERYRAVLSERSYSAHQLVDRVGMPLLHVYAHMHSLKHAGLVGTMKLDSGARIQYFWLTAQTSWS